jgi:hypothetical protein
VPVDFYLGTDRPHWLGTVDVPLFVSRRTLENRRTFPRALRPWALDSGGFTELHRRGGWTLTAPDYAALVRRFSSEVGLLEWAAPQDWMCEASALASTGATVADHQDATVENFVELRQLLGTTVVPVLQGWATDDYLRHADDYAAAGVDLEAEQLIGVGSICRRDADVDIGVILRELQPLRLHAFGVKGSAFVKHREWITSADSMAWSATARYSDLRLPGCTHRGRCSHCSRWALRWRANLLRQLDQGRLW